MGEPLSKSMIGRSAFWSIINQSTGQLLVLLVFLITARFVDKEDFGVMAVALMAIEAFRQVFIDSIMTGIYAQKDPDRKYYNAAFLVAVSGSIASATIIFLLSNPIAVLLKDDDIGHALRWISPLLVAIALSKVQESWLGKNYRFKSLALRSIVSIVIGGGIGIYMALNGYGIMALIIQQLITATIAAIWLWIATPWKPGLDTDKQSLHAVWSQGRYNASTGLIRFADGQSDVFFSSYYLGAAATGVYNAGKRIVTAISLILNSGLNSVALPAMASLSDNQDRSVHGYLKCVSYSAVITAPLYMGFIATSPDLIAVLLGEKWSDVAPVASILAFAGFISVFGQYNSNILLVKGKAHWNMCLTFAGAVSNLILFAIFARYGLIAMASAFTIKTLLFYPVTTAITLTLLNISMREYVEKIWPAITASIIMCASMFALAILFPLLPAWQNLLILIPSGAVIYAALLFLLDPKTFRDLYRTTSETWSHRT